MSFASIYSFLSESSFLVSLDILENIGPPTGLLSVSFEVLKIEDSILFSDPPDKLNVLEVLFPKRLELIIGFFSLSSVCCSLSSFFSLSF